MKMPLNKLELLTRPPKADWLVGNLFPLGHLAIVYAPAGIGKTRLISYLAAQVTRPEGLFLGHWVKQSKVLILDADDPSGFGYQTWLNRFLGAHYDTDRERIELRAITGGFTPDDVASLKTELKDDPPRLIVVDTFMSAFVGLDTLKGHNVQVALTGLTLLAKELHACVVCLDHVGKLRPGETVASRGPYGAAKTFSPRAVFALSRVPPKEVEGRDVLRFDCTKMSYAAEPPPYGVEITLENDDTLARVRRVDLPQADTLLEKAKGAIFDALKSAQGEPMPRQALLSAAVSSANVTKRYAEKALKDLTQELGSRLEVINLGGQGNPKGYLWKGEHSVNEESSVQDEELFAEQPSSLNPLVRALKDRLEAGAWEIPNAQALLETIRKAETGDEDAIQKVNVYLGQPDVKKRLEAALEAVAA